MIKEVVEVLVVKLILVLVLVLVVEVVLVVLGVIVYLSRRKHGEWSEEDLLVLIVRDEV